MKKSLFLLASMLLLAGCGSVGAESVEYTSSSKSELQDKYGISYTSNEKLYTDVSIEDMVRDPNTYTDAYVKITGTVTKVNKLNGIMEGQDIWIADRDFPNAKANFSIRNKAGSDFKTYFVGDKVTVYGVNIDRVDRVWYEPINGEIELIIEDVNKVELK